MRSLTKITTYLFFTLPFLLVLVACGKTPALVHNLAEFQAAASTAQPGDKITLANGVWQDVELVLSAQGTQAAPIVLTVEEKGTVTLEGQSSLAISGAYLVVEGLVFKNGYTPTSEVISFRTGKDELCNHCRVTECVVDNFNNPERFESDYWVAMYGRNNRFDHNYLTGKRNSGVTMAVRLNTKESQENHHLIDHNYFGHRPVLGSNGGETLRIGTSHYSMTNSNTVVEANYFDRTNGEHEIISNKSGQNIYRSNTFFECQGTLTMRHGNETLVENNYFIGNGKSNTGGIRIINEKQRVINNYGSGLTGYRFRGALVIMNGVPNSPINRYFQVVDSEASGNVFIDCDYIQLCAGSDPERSATPVNTLVANNIFYNTHKDSLFTVYDDVSGIRFVDNILSPNGKAFQAEGFKNQSLTFAEEQGVKIPVGTPAGENIRKGLATMATPENTGVSWYPRREEEQVLRTGKTISVGAGTNTLLAAMAESAAGDRIELRDTGTYLLTKTMAITHPLSFVAASGLPTRPLLRFEKSALFSIENGGALDLQGLHIDGAECPDVAGNAVIRTSRYSMVRNYKLFVTDCDFTNLNVNHSFAVLQVFKNTFADSIVLRNSTFRTISGAVLALDQETDDLGIYNAESVVLDNCVFADIGGPALNLYRGGSDESTFGPMLTIDHCTFDRVGKDKRNKTGSAVALHGVQVAYLTNNLFTNSQPLNLHLVVGEPITVIDHCNFYPAGSIVDNGEPYQKAHITQIEPVFSPPTSQTLAPASPLRNMGGGGEPLGFIQH
jgi:poly(beta-D-mannuronate) lyase